jgi:hypothetical protein
MNIVNDYLDILQNIESAIVTVYRRKPELRDPDVITAMVTQKPWAAALRKI